MIMSGNCLDIDLRIDGWLDGTFKVPADERTHNAIAIPGCTLTGSVWMVYAQIFNQKPNVSRILVVFI